MDISRFRRFARVLLISSLVCASATAQVTLKEGQVFEPKCSGWSGTCHFPVTMLDAPDGPVLFGQQGDGSRLFRLDANDVPTGELVLEDVESGGSKWSAIACQQVNGKTYVLLVDGFRKGRRLGMAEVNLQAPMSMGEVKEVLKAEWPISDPNAFPVLGSGTPKRWLTDYFYKGYSWPDRLRSSPNGRYMVVSVLDRKHWGPTGAGVNFFYSVVGPDLTVLRTERLQMPKAHPTTPFDIGITDSGLVYQLNGVHLCGGGYCEQIWLTLFDGQKMVNYTTGVSRIPYCSDVQCLPDGRLAFAFTEKGAKGFETKVLVFDPAQAADPKVELLDRRAKGVQVFNVGSMELPSLERKEDALPGAVDLQAYQGGLLLTEQAMEHRVGGSGAGTVTIGGGGPGYGAHEEGSIRLTRIDPQSGVQWSTVIDRYYAYWSHSSGAMVQVDMTGSKLQVMFNDREADHDRVPDKKWDKQPEELTVVELDGNTGAITSRAVLWRSTEKHFAQIAYALENAAGATTLIPVYSEKGGSQYLRLSE